jgi:uncharacterized repeat protein (TIGR01451 family)
MPLVHRFDLATRWSPLRAGVVLAFCAFAVAGWFGVTTVSRGGAIDSGEHLAYAQYLDAHGRLPPKAVNYEYSSPPLFQLAAVGAERAVGALPSVAVELSSNPVTRALWLLLVAGGVAALTSRRRGLRIAGAAALGLGAIWGLDEAISLATSEPWSAGRLIALASGLGLVLVTGLIAREVWPGHTGRAVAAGAFAAAYPVVYRMSILFHPEAPFALLCGLAVLVLLRAASRSWPSPLGWWLGVLCGAAALTRQPAALVIATLGAAALWIGKRGATGFVVRAAIVALLLAGPWWGYAYNRWHNPFQSNLAPRASLMMGRQPASFYFSVPLESLVVHPYRPDFSDALLPKLHAELWSDWFGGIHDWDEPTRVEKATASTQSVLGLLADALAIGGLALLAVPALVRILRRREETRSDVGLAVLGLLAVVSFAAFTVMLIRFPQRYGDPIKTSYLLFTTPCWAIFSVAAWSKLRRHHRVNLLLVAAAVAYVASYTADLSSALAQPSGTPVGGAAGFVDLQATIQQTSPNPGLGGDIDFLVGVVNAGNQTAGSVVLTVRLPAGMRLLGAPYYERGSGCSGSRTIVCPLDFLAGGDSTLIRYSVQVTGAGPQTTTAGVSSSATDANPGDNQATYSVTLAPAS